jgi:Tol biopolymer transport system component
MGEVYRARDNKLDRDVAIKVLPEGFANDADYLARFEREAKLLASLNHANIAAIYGLEDEGDQRFIAMELVEGANLADRIAARGRIPVDEALAIARQIAKALEAAHDNGVIHRDLKPANVIITPEGKVKVLDFGLAKSFELDESGESHTDLGHSPTMLDATRAGMILGTAAYMSPEQARGKALDKRGDVWAFGCVLYEMLAGKAPFEGETVSDVMAAILRSEPEWGELPHDLPWRVRELIERCLERDPRRRLRDIGEAWLAIERAGTDETQMEEIGASASGFKGAVLAAAALATVTAALGYWLGATVGRPPVAAGPRLGSFARVTADAIDKSYPSLSPDGEFVVYSSRTAGTTDIYLQRVGGERPINLTDDFGGDDTQPAFSPDGQRIAFRSGRDGGGIFVMGATGENVRRLSAHGYNPAWAPDGSEVVFSDADIVDPFARGSVPAQLWVVDVSSGEQRLASDGDAVQPSWSPNGSRIAYWGIHEGGQRDIWTIPAEGGEAVQVTGHAAVDWNPSWSADGNWLYFLSDRGGSMNIWRVPIDERSGEVRGDTEPVVAASSNTQYLSLSRDGRYLAYVQLNRRTNLQEVEFDPVSGRPAGFPRWITRGAREVKNPHLSPDGERFVFDAVEDQREDLFVVRRDGSGLSRMTDDFYKDRAARWSPDGESILFLSDRSGRYEAWLVRADGSDLRKVSATVGEHWAQAPLWAPDAAHITVNTAEGAPLSVEVEIPWEQQTPIVLAPGGDPADYMFAWSWTQEGDLLAGWNDGIVVYDTSAQSREHLTDFGTRPVWIDEGNRLLFFDEDAVYLLDRSTKRTTEILKTAPHRIQSFGISSDLRSLYLSVTQAEADIWIAELQ